jgi:uncharacterized protein YggE
VVLGAVVIVSITRDAIINNNPWREISVNGTGKVMYMPDIAHVTLGVHVESDTAQSALSQLTTTTTQVISAIQALGVAPEKISTQNLSVYPQYYYPADAPSVTSGYTADQQLVIEIAIGESTALIGSVIQAASSQGANQVQSVTFEASNVEDLRQQAVLLAIEDARERADSISDATDVKLGDIVSWWENPISVPGDPVFDYQQRMGGYGGEMMEQSMNVPAGTGEVIMQVTVNYETK